MVRMVSRYILKASGGGILLRFLSTVGASEETHKIIQDS
jgi:hypothetical protein